ncbi:MAG: phenylalanine--tRNA ligase subunit beta [Tannerella sp.]|jgi:phenylalanyl-tRNA synthetase beta chain|nr:phenylalanine--tRNA ligase subunit beta [Tannerella sp.]
MNISYNWLKEYLAFDLSPVEVAAALTSIGLETGRVEEVQPVRGGLEGLVTGEVLTCVAHPNSDHLRLTTVCTGGTDSPLQIVCGAPNVTAGQKVIVAPVGAVLWRGDEKLVIKRSRIRGEESLGMICSEDEIGIGTDRSGIIVLPPDTEAGIPARDFYHIENDWALEVDITPNRVDATSHYGVARDLAAFLKQSGRGDALRCPSVDGFSSDATADAIRVESVDGDACLRYSGVTVRGVKVKESPDWLKNRLRSIGLRPINNVVDITNFVLHELGQPLHAFDVSRIKGGTVTVRTLPEGTKCVTLDGVERTLSAHDVMICNAEEPMCIGGVFGGLDSGVTEETTDVFLESACFHPSRIRKTARRLGLNTDSSFRFERGLDPNRTLFALKRAALLVREIAGGVIAGSIQDIYPERVEPYPVDVAYRKINALTGMEIAPDTVKSILASLEIDIVAESDEGLSTLVPVYRIDVRREVDVIEEILRIYGYNRIGFKDRLQSTLSYRTETDRSYQLENLISEQLCGAGFHEIINNSLVPLAHCDRPEASQDDGHAVTIENPLSADLNCMRRTLLFGGLQSIGHNLKHKNRNIRFFEFGTCYSFNPDRKDDGAQDPLRPYGEEYRLGLWMCGNRVENNWAHPNEASSVYELKAHVQNILARLGIRRPSCGKTADDLFAAGAGLLTQSGKTLGEFGAVHPKLLKMMDIDTEVYYAELNWKALLREARKNRVTATGIARFPEVRRDLALLIDRETPFEDIEKIAYESERRLLKRITLFDVYEGRNLPQGKKSYAVSFYLQDESRTLEEKQIDAIMNRIRKGLEEKTGASLR